jgi:hypothetical protein
VRSGEDVDPNICTPVRVAGAAQTSGSSTDQREQHSAGDGAVGKPFGDTGTAACLLASTALARPGDGAVGWGRLVVCTNVKHQR